MAATKPMQIGNCTARWLVMQAAWWGLRAVLQPCHSLLLSCESLCALGLMRVKSAIRRDKTDADRKLHRTVGW
jgi:hypothetical protein